MAKTTITFFLRIKDGKKVVEKTFSDLQTLYEARREAEKAGTFFSVGAHVTVN
jgi:hypothetical protein